MEIDCSETFIDHSKILINVEKIGDELTNREFASLYNQIASQTHSAVPNTGRVLKFRYAKASTTVSEWQNFQAHRRVFGLICVFVLPKKLEDRANTLQRAKQSYANLRQASQCLDSRLYIYGDDESETVDNKKKKKLLHISTQGPFDDPLSASLLNIKDQQKAQNSEGSCNLQDKHSDTYVNISKITNFKRLCSSVQAFYEALYWQIENDRCNKAREIFDPNSEILFASPELNVIKSLSKDTSYKKRYKGRQLKRSGDLCLLAGLPGDAILCYEESLESLEKVADLLWIAGCLEGICASVIIKSIMGCLDDDIPFQRNNSYNSTLSAIATQRMPIIGVPGASQVHKMHLDVGSAGKQATPTHVQSPMSRLPHDFIDRCNNAVNHYCQEPYATNMELLFLIKSVRILIKFGFYVEASVFLKNILFIPDSEKINREKIFATLAQFYGEMNMFRKQAFFYRFLAMQIVESQQHIKDKAVKANTWTRSYNEILNSFPGFNISLEPRDMLSVRPNKRGWISIQLRVLYEVLCACDKLDDQPLTIRHLSFLLEIYHQQMNARDVVTCSKSLAIVAKKFPMQSQKSLSVGNAILPPVQMFSFPILTDVKLSALDKCNRPIRMRNHLSPTCGPAHVFIYSPIQAKKNNKREQSLHYDFNWVSGQTSLITLTFVNPLSFPIEFRIVDLLCPDLCVNATEVYCAVPSTPLEVKVHATPKFEVQGRLKVMGYVVETFNVRSECSFADVMRFKLSRQLLKTYEVDVLCVLPTLNCSTSSFDNHDSLDTIFEAFKRCHTPSLHLSKTVVVGQSYKCEVNLENTSEIEINNFEFSVESLSDICNVNEYIKITNYPCLKEKSSAILDISAEFPSNILVNKNKITKSTEISIVITIKYGNNNNKYGYHICLAIIFMLQPSFIINTISNSTPNYKDICLNISLSKFISEECTLTYANGEHQCNNDDNIQLQVTIPKLPYEDFLKLILTNASSIIVRNLNKYINDCVSLKWKSINSEGSIDLCKEFPSDFLQVQLFNNPFTIECTFNGEPCKDDKLEIQLGEVVYIDCHITKIKPKNEYKKVFFQLKVYKTRCGQGAGGKEDLEVVEADKDDFVLIGCSSLHCDNIDKQEVITCGIMIVKQGKFTLNLQGKHYCNNGKEHALKVNFPEKLSCHINDM